ncbi:MAG: hypothetical protein Q8R13_02435 [bacterium]|nr:hypothetical protein [bacterium]MDZ4295744.1 hypothetical protein [Patescibacteria group bacterium]
MDKALAIEHIRNHVDYPASARELKESCNSMAEFSDEDKQWFSDHLPNGTYNSADDVVRALGW